jgi:hypothetical protein
MRIETLIVGCLIGLYSLQAGELEKKQYQLMRESVRKTLVAPDTAKWWAPYAEGIIGDRPDTDCEALTLKEDYWFASGLVDCSGKLGNLSRSEWVIISDKKTGEIVYQRFDKSSSGTIPTKSKDQVRREKQVEEMKAYEARLKQEEERQQQIHLMKIKQEEADERLRLWKEKLAKERSQNTK